METQNLLENAKEKLLRKNADMIIANDLRIQGAGFGTDTNVVTIITEDRTQALELMSKEAVAGQILNEILKRQ